jgi:hypothetical protein
MDPQDLFARIYVRSMKGRLAIDSFRRVAELGRPHAEEALAEEARRIALEAFARQSGGSSREDIKAILEKMSPQQLVTFIHGKTLVRAQACLDAASIIFAHSMVDSAAWDCCRVAAWLAPVDWLPRVENRKLPLSEIKGRGFDELLTLKLSEFISDLERDSLMKKVDLLFAFCRPPEKWSPVEDYTFDRDRLEKLDNLRHELVHGERLGKSIPSCAKDIDYLARTPFLLMELVSFRYGLKLDERSVARLLLGPGPWRVVNGVAYSDEQDD